MYSLSALLLIGGVVASFRVYQYTEHEMDRSFVFSLPFCMVEPERQRARDCLSVV